MLQERIAENRWFNSTVQELFVETCFDRPDKIAIFFEGEKITFRELQNNVNKLSQSLLSLGVKPGDHIVTLPIPCPEFAYLYFATLQIGAVINPLNLLWGAIEFKGVLERNDPKIIICVDEYGGKIFINLIRESIPDLMFRDDSVTSERIRSLTHLVSFSREGKKYHGFLDFNEVFESGSHFEKADLMKRVKEGKPNDIQFICQTSGTTGLSKSALWDHRPPLASVNFGAKHIAFSEEDTFICQTPFFHNSGLFALNLNLALAGTTLYLMERFDPKKALELIDKYEITTTFGFDTHWQGMKQVPNFENYNFTIKKALIAAEPRTYDLVREMCQAENPKIINLYAQTENGPNVSLGEHDCMVYEINKYTHGRPLPGVEIIIKDIVSGKALSQGEAGEICYKSPYMFKGYYKQEEETKRLFDEEGYFHSEDFGILRNGYVQFLGRLGGVVKSGGENVSTVRVTSFLLEHFHEEFDDMKTVGVPDQYWGTKVVSWVRMKPGKKLRPVDQIRKECKGRMADYEIPKEFLEWEEEWPMTAEGKIDFKKLEKEAEGRVTSD